MLTTFVAVSAAAILYLCDTVYADAISSWRFEAGVGLHNPVVPTVAVILYVAMVYFLPKVMANREPVSLKPVMLVHNLILSVGSLVMLVAIVREVGDSAGHCRGGPN